MNTIPGHTFSDKHLVEKVLDGDRQAFGQIIKNTEGLVAQIVFKMVSNPEDRKDIVQDIYLKVFHKLGSFRFQSKLSTWIGQVSYNTCFDYLQKKKLVLPGTIGEYGMTDHEETATGNNNTLDNATITGFSAGQKELAGILKTKINKLSPIFRTLIVLYHQEELSYEEIGEVTGLPAGTIKSYLSRARKKLKDSLLVTYKKEDL